MLAGPDCLAAGGAPCSAQSQEGDWALPPQSHRVKLGAQTPYPLLA